MLEFFVSLSNTVPLIECTLIALHVSVLSYLDTASWFCNIGYCQFGCLYSSLV